VTHSCHAEADYVYREVASGIRTYRAHLRAACSTTLEAGDVLLVTSSTASRDRRATL
jgi:hypothetical protein